MTFKKILILTFLLVLGSIVRIQAQKLPNIQQNSLRAPRNINIDGKKAEWGSFQAYNHATDVFYSIANDDQNLYLIIQTDDPSVLLKVFSSGISWSLKRSEYDKTPVNITYPVLPHTPYMHLISKKNDLDDTSAKTVSLWVQSNNKMLNDSCKFIRVDGVSGLDTLISIFNRDGVKAKGLFNSKKAYVCEFSIRLDLLKISEGHDTKLNYEIRINGAKPLISVVIPDNASPEMRAGLAKAQQVIAEQSAPTYCRGEYTIIKK